MWRIPRWETASIDRVGDGRGRGDRSGFARAFDTHRIDRRRRDGPVELVDRHHVRLGNRVVAQRAGQQLAVVVVDRAFVERLGHALGDAAVDLAIDDQRVDDVADIVDRDVAEYFDLPVSRSTSTTQMCVPKGKVQLGGS